MSDQRIRVQFTHITMLRKTDLIGSGDLYCIASVDGNSIGNRDILTTEQGRRIALPANLWTAEVDVATKTEVIVRAQVKDWDRFSADDDLGSLTYALRPPWTQATWRTVGTYFILEWKVMLLADGSFDFHPTNTVFACREINGMAEFTTVGGGSGRMRAEIHPVIPLPPAASHPPRPVMPAGTGPPWTGGAASNITPASPINVVPNPAYIPLLAPADASATTAAVLELTYYQPASLAFTDGDDRLRWSAVSVSGGAAVAFVGQPRGRKVLVYGTTAGEVRLEVRFGGVVVTSYRAIVGRIKQVPCRFNILNGPTVASQPRSTPADVQAHLVIANRLLRQAGIELVLDTVNTVTNGAVVTTVPGIFRINVSAGVTRNFASAGFPTCTRLNSRPNVMNFAYVRSDASGNLGAAIDFPANGAGGTITDNGTLSSSWSTPSGVPPDGTAGNLTMKLLAKRQRPAQPQLFSMYVTDANGIPTQPAAQMTYAGTIAHELGHILNLGHRVDTTPLFNDSLNFPPAENLMHWTNPTTLAQDIDIIQVRAIHRSPLVPP